MKREKWFSPLNILAALLIALLIISASVTATLFDRGAYVRLQDKYGLAQAAGISRGEVLENYNALIDYNSVFFQGRLEFPTLPMSDSGRTHFEEVKNIFSVFQIMLIVSAVSAAACCIALLKKRRYRFLALGGIFALAIPAIVLGLMSAVGWDRFFVLFHEAFFSNEFWVFDAVSDPVILILPDAFFLSCLIRIVLCIVIASAAIITGSGLLKRART